MKGTPNVPKCGYSKIVSEILKLYKGTNFSFINILNYPELWVFIKEVTKH